MPRKRDGVWVNAQLTREEFLEWARLARLKGYTRSSLIALALREVGLDFARKVEPTENGAVHLVNGGS